jgi:hypothetical protein
VNRRRGHEQTGCGDRPRAAHTGSQIRQSDGIRRNTAVLNPNDAIELSKVSMTNLSSASDDGQSVVSSDAEQALLLGEGVAISILRDQRSTFNEPFSGFTFSKFDGTTITV